jgi:hypothetical protein
MMSPEFSRNSPHGCAFARPLELEKKLDLSIYFARRFPPLIEGYPRFPPYTE